MSKITKRRVTTEKSLKIEDDELGNWLILRATKTAAEDHARLKKEADLHRAVLKKEVDLPHFSPRGCCIMDERATPTKLPDGEWLH